MTHESYKQHTQNAPYHTILRRKIHKFSGEGHSPSPDPTPLAGAAYGASILASSALALRPANVPVAATPMTVTREQLRFK